MLSELHTIEAYAKLVQEYIIHNGVSAEEAIISMRGVLLVKRKADNLPKLDSLVKPVKQKGEEYEEISTFKEPKIKYLANGKRKRRNW